MKSVKSGGFHRWNPGEIRWNLPDFKRPIARNGKPYVFKYGLSNERRNHTLSPFSVILIIPVLYPISCHNNFCPFQSQSLVTQDYKWILYIAVKKAGDCDSFRMKMRRFEQYQSTERRSRELREELVYRLLDTNETDFIGSVTMSPFR